MSKDLELMFSLLQQEVEEFTAELACEDFDDLSHTNHKNLEIVTGFNPIEVTPQKSIDSMIKEKPSFSINNGYSSSEKSISNKDLHLDTTFHQKSNFPKNLSPESSINNTKQINVFSSSEKLTSSPLNYSRLRSLSNSSNISVSTSSPIPSPRSISKVAFIISSDSENDDVVSSSSSDDSSESDGDSDDSPLIMTREILLPKQSSLTELSNSSDNDQKSIISKENVSKSSHESKEAKRIPTIGRSFNSSLKDFIDSPSTSHKDNVKSYDENLSFNPRMNSINSRTPDINLEEKQTVRSKVQESNLDIHDSSVRTHLNKKFERTDHLENSSRSLKSKERGRSKEQNSDDHKDRSGKSREHEPRPRSSEIGSDEWEGSKCRGENGVKGIQMHSRDHETDTREKAKSRVRGNENRIHRNREPSHEIGSEKTSQTNEYRTRARSRVHGEEERGMTKSGVHGEEENGRAKSRVQEENGRAKSRVRGEEERGRATRVRGEEENGRAKSRVRGEEERGRATRVRGDEENGRAKSRVRGEEESGRATRVRGDEERGRAKSNIYEEEERGRSKSKVRGEEEHGRTKSKIHVEERGIAKSRTLEEEHGRSKSKPREREVEARNYNKENNKSRTNELWDKEKPFPYRREKAETFVESKAPKITELKITTQIFIEDVRQYKKLSITSNKTALDILNYFRSNDTIHEKRPIRDWEYVATVIGAWELDKPNALVLKRDVFRSCLTLKGFNNAVPPMFGWLHLEIKKNKWQKRYFYTKEGVIYHSKDSKGNNETFLCSLANFDVYTMTKTVKKSPTKFIFVLKSQDKIAMFENPEKDYLHYLCADHMDKKRDWVFSLRASKNNLMRAENPERFIEKPLEIVKTNVSDNHDKLRSNTDSEKPLTSENSMDLNANVNNGTAVSEKHRSNNQWESLRKAVRNSSSKPLKGKFENFVGTISTTNGDQPFKGGSLLDFDEKNSPIKQVELEGVSFVKGSLLASNDSLFEQAKEREKLRKAMGGIGIIRDPNSTTFVNLDNSVKFNKGSLLGRNNDTISENNNNSNHLIQIEDGITFNKGTLLTKYKEGTSTGHLIQIEDGVQFNKGSLLTKVQESNERNNNSQRLKPLGTLLKIDAPLSKSLTTHNLLSPTMLTNGKTLLELNLKADATHTLSLRNTNIKPLLNFVPKEYDQVEGVKSPRNFIKFNESETDSEYYSNGDDSN
ncbi:18121_t:CDS:10 [Funneliformis geosporum]|nr:18121_t:CDS:10 [Funneliformis geosporum]